MMSRTLSLAAASLLGCLIASPGQAQQNLDAGKSPSQIFNGNCGVCHRSAKGLLKTVSPSSLPDFLRQHYTTGGDMAQMLSGYLTSNRAGAAEPEAPAVGKRGARPPVGASIRPDAPIGAAGAGEGGGIDQSKPDKKPPRAATAKPEGEGSEPAEGPEPAAPAAGKRHGRHDQAARPPGSPPEGAAASPPGGPGPKSKLARRGKGAPPVPPMPPSPDVAAKPEAAPPKDDQAKDVQTKPSDRSVDAAVPVPEPVTLPPPTAADIKPAEAKPAETRSEPSAAATADKPAVDKPVAAPQAAAPPAEAAVAPGGPPAPPISQ
jgi:hypothetical protein